MILVGFSPRIATYPFTQSAKIAAGARREMAVDTD